MLSSVSTISRPTPFFEANLSLRRVPRPTLSVSSLPNSFIRKASMSKEPNAGSINSLENCFLSTRPHGPDSFSPSGTSVRVSAAQDKTEGTTPLLDKDIPEIEELTVEEAVPPSPQRPYAMAAAIASAALCLLLIGYSNGGPSVWLEWTQGKIQEASDAAQSAGPLAPLYYGLLYMACTIFLLPASVLTIGAGFIFGALQGTLVVSVASTSAAALSFLIARYAARPFVTRQLSKSPKFALVDKAIARDGWKIVFLWRLSPIFPFGASNYMFGLTAVKFFPYVGASWVAMLPATFTYVYLGSIGRATVDVVSDDTDANVGLFKIGLYVVGAIATLLVTREVSSRASKALKEAEEEDSQT